MYYPKSQHGTTPYVIDHWDLKWAHVSGIYTCIDLPISIYCYSSNNSYGSDNHISTDRLNDKVILSCDPRGMLGIIVVTAFAGVLLRASRQYQTDITR